MGFGVGERASRATTAPPGQGRLFGPRMTFVRLSHRRRYPRRDPYAYQAPSCHEAPKRASTPPQASTPGRIRTPTTCTSPSAGPGRCAARPSGRARWPRPTKGPSQHAEGCPLVAPRTSGPPSSPAAARLPRPVPRRPPATRNLSQSAGGDFVGNGTPYLRTCPTCPSGRGAGQMLLALATKEEQSGG